METKIKKLFDDNFDFAFKAATYNNMRVAIQTFEQRSSSMILHLILKPIIQYL